MQIEKVVAAIRQSDIGKVMYKARPSSNFVGVFGLKPRPSDKDFLETGTLDDIGFGPVVTGAHKRFRQSIPKDFAIIIYPESFYRHEDEVFIRPQYQMVDIDLYTYLVTTQAIKSDKLGIESSNYNNLFYLDGRLVDFSEIIHKNMYNYSFILSEYSPLIPYIYRKRTPEFFTDENVEDVLINVKKYAKDFNVEMSFDSLQLLSGISPVVT